MARYVAGTKGGKVPSKDVAGSFFHLGLSVGAFGATKEGVSVGEVNKSLAFTKRHLSGMRNCVLYLSKGAGGGYMTNKARQMFVASLRYYIDHPDELRGANWAPYSDKYKEWKAKEYPGKGMWKRTGQLQRLIKPLNLKATGQSVGIDPKPTSHLHTYGKKLQRGAGKMPVAEVARRMEFGWRGGDGSSPMPARPLFAPVLKQFMRDEFPQALRAVEKSIFKTHEKFFQTPMGKPSDEKRVSATTSEWSTTGGIVEYSDNVNMHDAHIEYLKSDADKYFEKATRKSGYAWKDPDGI